MVDADFYETPSREEYQELGDADAEVLLSFNAINLKINVINVITWRMDVVI